MLNLKVLFFLLTWNFSEILSCTIPNKILIEGIVTNTSIELIDRETKVVKNLKNFYDLLKICSSNLKASNISENFIEVIETYAAKVQNVQTMKNHKLLNISLETLTCYDYAQFRITKFFADVRNLQEIKENLSKNATQLYKLNNRVVRQYLRNYKTMIKLRSKNKLINLVLRNSMSIFSAFGTYAQLLSTHIRNFMKLNAYNGNLIKSKSVLPQANASTDNFITSVRLIESKLVSGQQQLITMCKIAMRKIVVAQKSVAKRRQVQATDDISSIFTSVTKTLNATSTTNDYSLLGWPQIPLPDTSMVQLRSTISDAKDSTYAKTETMNLVNSTDIKTKTDALNETVKTVKSSARSVQSSQTILDVLASLINVGNAHSNYGNKLRAARVELRAITENLMAMTTIRSTEFSTSISVIPATTANVITTSSKPPMPTYPTMRLIEPITTTGFPPTTTGLPPTTTGLPATTTRLPTTLYPTTPFVVPECGTFLPFNPLTDLGVVQEYGVNAGVYADGYGAFVGKGDVVGRQTPARISINPTKAGAFMTDQTTEIFDNKTAYFLANHESIIWGLVNEKTAPDYFYGLRYRSLKFPMMIGRKNISGVTYIGRFHFGNGLFGMYIYRPDLAQIVKLDPSEDFEVVGCKELSPPCFQGIKLDPLLNPTAPFLRGVIAGVHFDGSLSFPGKSDMEICAGFGIKSVNTVVRIATDPKNIGGYMTCYNTAMTISSEVPNAQLSFAFRNSIGMAWKRTTLANAPLVEGFYGWFDNNANVTVGRYQMSNWTMIGRVVYNGPNAGFYGWDPQTNTVLKLPATSEFDILTCVPSL